MRTHVHRIGGRHLLVGSIALASLVSACGGTESPDGETPDPSATVVSDTPTTPVTSGDQAVDEVQSDLDSLDADLQVIDDALAELASIAP